jgi:methyl-accepting chemotaxis protein
LQRLADGDLAVAVTASPRRDEVGALRRAFAQFRDQALENRAMVEAREAERRAAQQERQTAMRSMAERIETETTAVVQSAASLTDALAATAADMTLSADRTGDAARVAAGAAGQALGNAQAVSGAAEQLSASMRDITLQLAQSSRIVGRAVEAGHETRQSFDVLNGKVTQIGTVANLITDIAARTNLLALNATIEAARAGEAGRGFAVVAGEVKQLALQTARSTDEITRTINEVRAAASDSIAAVDRIEKTVDEVSGLAASIAAAVEQQGAATAEIARNVTETAGAARAMNARMEDVAREAVETRNRAGKVNNSASDLELSVAALRQTVVRVVRTSSEEVQRRQHPRLATALPCRLTVAGTEHTGQLRDLSQGGAAITALPHTQHVQHLQRGTLTLDGMATPLAFKSVAWDDGVLHVAFDDEANPSLAAFIARLAPAKAA